MNNLFETEERAQEPSKPAENSFSLKTSLPNSLYDNAKKSSSNLRAKTNLSAVSKSHTNIPRPTSKGISTQKPLH